MKKLDFKNISIFLDPSSKDFSKNQIFNTSNIRLNRDGTLLPFCRLKSAFGRKNISINTADILLLEDEANSEVKLYYSMGMTDNLGLLKKIEGVIFKAILIMEPPIVAPELYDALPLLSNLFEEVYVHNIVGDGYSLAGVDQSKFRKLFWPQPYWGTLDKFWNQNDRLNKVVVINGNHRPKRNHGELYSKRIDAVVGLSKFDAVDLYGRGWNRWWARSSFWLPYWSNRNRLASVYKGECISKYEVLSRYRFCLCFENMEMRGYITEKIFDCFYAGTIPIYWGAPDVAQLIPGNSYIDAKKYQTWEGLWGAISELTDDEVTSMRRTGKKFLSSNEFKRYYHSLESILKKSID